MIKVSGQIVKHVSGKFGGNRMANKTTTGHTSKASGKITGITTIASAVTACRQTGLRGWALVAYAQNLAARQFTYSRRNPWDSPAQAFARGQGYCQQQALALKQIYDGLEIVAQPVYATRCKFPPAVIHRVAEPERISGHTWLRVQVGNETRDVCPGRVENQPGQIHFEILSKVRPLWPWLRPFTHLGSIIANARRDRRARNNVASSDERTGEST
jgi:hypothetical protein